MQRHQPIRWKKLQMFFIAHRKGAEAVFMIERLTELAREWSLPKSPSKILYHISHNQVEPHKGPSAASRRPDGTSSGWWVILSRRLVDVHGTWAARWNSSPEHLRDASLAPGPTTCAAPALGGAQCGEHQGAVLGRWWHRSALEVQQRVLPKPPWCW